MISRRTVGRLSLYRRILHELAAEGVFSVYSHQLAAKAGETSQLVRHDLMAIGYRGKSTTGYDVHALSESIREFLDAETEEKVALVGVGNLGRALLSFFTTRHYNHVIAAAFDSDPGKHGRIVVGCRCHPMECLERIIREECIRLAIIAVPVREAQSVAMRLVDAGIAGILNFAPTLLHLPEKVMVEDIDMTMSLERLSFFTRNHNIQEGGGHAHEHGDERCRPD